MTNKDILRQYVDTGIALPEEQIKLLSGGLLTTYIRKRKIALENGGGIGSCYELKLLYPDLKVPGNLDLYNSNISRLPDNLTVNGNLDLRHTNITEMPDNLTINGNLFLSDTNITELPSSLVVKRKIIR